MNWGKSIILAFVLFGGFIATLVTVCMKQDVNLVTRDYYKEELAYQTQINRMEQTAMLPSRPVISVEPGNMVKVTYTELDNVQAGVLELFRPSDPALDKQFELRDSKVPSLYFSTAGMEKGLYRARLRWTMKGQEYFVEQVIQL